VQKNTALPHPPLIDFEHFKTLTVYVFFLARKYEVYIYILTSTKNTKNKNINN